MTSIVKMAIIAAALALAGCAMPQAPVPGETLEAVRARLGAPTGVYPAPDGQVLEYATGPFGQYTYMARIGPDGRLVSWEQVLTGEKFATIRIDSATKADVLRALGRPAEKSRVALHNYEVWSYRYKEAGVWDSLMHVHFDEQGVVRQMMNGPDPRFEKDGRFGF